jgi:hypothetical protein
MTALYGHFQDWISLSQGRQHFVISILLVIGQNFFAEAVVGGVHNQLWALTVSFFSKV